MSVIRPALMLLAYGGAVVFSGAGAFSQTPAGGEFRVNSYTTGSQRGVRVAMDEHGDFVAVWDGVGAPGRGVVGQRFDAAGYAESPEFLVAGGNAGRAAVARLASGGFVVVWEATDASDSGVFARRYSRD